MAKRNRRRLRLKNDMNVVPYIDVMLVLLVIFMVTTPLLIQGTIHLPSVGQASVIPNTPVEIQIDARGNLSLRLRQPGHNNFALTDEGKLIQDIQNLSPNGLNTPIVISADGDVSYKTIIHVMDLLRTHGYKQLGLLVNERAVSPAFR